MAVETHELIKTVKTVMGPIFEMHGFRFRQEAGLYLWAKAIDNTGEHIAAISFERHNPAPDDRRYTMRIYVADGEILDVLSYVEGYLPSKNVRRNLEIKRGLLDRMSGYEWYPYPSTLDNKEVYFEQYANELLDKLEATIPKALRWLKK